MSVKRKIRCLEKMTNIDDIKYDIRVQHGIIKSPTETIWFENEESWRRYEAERKALKQQPGNRTSHDDRDRTDLENDSGL